MQKCICYNEVCVKGHSGALAAITKKNLNQCIESQAVLVLIYMYLTMPPHHDLLLLF